jgi:hypothetical protein
MIVLGDDRLIERTVIAGRPEPRLPTIAVPLA